MAERGDGPLATHLYFDRKYKTEAVRVLPGEYYATSRDMLLATVLGSCVTACIRDKQNGIGGMNHFMLPRGCIDENDPSSMPARYGIYAMEILINQVIKIGARRANLEAKVFGGGNVLPGLVEVNVGERNAEFVLNFLETESIPVVAHDLVDIYPRKVYYFPSTGKALVKKLRDLPNSAIVEREKDFGSNLSKARVSGDIELFS
ncbi:chemotaxis protein CheD [Nitrosospira sp. Nl5]|uniref:chemoreceptor glutamine deamidase CheD n=1 Tax=Nitrosospira sp. Nl5 TaxID=200120 RepID=UPI000890DBF1|nr:chemoreceptor glutamine deamidase CheD [Nitrosospira sp. Nl5]SCY07326.1 chemotaxis protein CheD [Nitrosospira sp. Nl5]